MHLSPATMPKNSTQSERKNTKLFINNKDNNNNIDDDINITPTTITKTTTTILMLMIDSTIKRRFKYRPTCLLYAKYLHTIKSLTIKITHYTIIYIIICNYLY